MERKKAAAADDALDWKKAQTELIRGWDMEYRREI